MGGRPRDLLTSFVVEYLFQTFGARVISFDWANMVARAVSVPDRGSVVMPGGWLSRPCGVIPTSEPEQTVWEPRYGVHNRSFLQYIRRPQVLEFAAHPAAGCRVSSDIHSQRWSPSFGQVSGQIKVKSGFISQAASSLESVFRTVESQSRTAEDELTAAREQLAQAKAAAAR